MDELFEVRRTVIDAIEICSVLTEISNELDSLDLNTVREFLLDTPLGEDAVNSMCDMLENSRDFLFIEKSRVSEILKKDMQRLRDGGII